jgi:signal transduction histidine kinase
MPDVPLQYGRGLTSKVMEMKKPLVINENWLHESVKYNAIYRNSKMAKSSIAVPLMIQERAIGVISIDNTEREFAFTENDVRLLETIAANLAIAIENARLQESMKQEFKIQEKLVSQLEKKNEELERFTYTASHDLKAPLITIRGYLGYIEKDAKSGNYQRLLRDTQRISEATEKMHRLLNELLELSRIGRIINKSEEILFADIVKDALERVENQIRERKVKIKIADKLGSVVVDKERMIEVVQNLVDNAIKFMGKQTDPEIEIGMKKQGNETVYFIKDNGIGIKKEFHERIFGLFDKLDSESEGTGIGLALVKRIIEVHGGKIWVESEEGKGTTFCFTLSSGS